LALKIPATPQQYQMSNIFVKFLKPILSNLISQVDRRAIKIFEYLKEHIVLFTKKKNIKKVLWIQFNSSHNNDFLMSRANTTYI